MAERAVEERRLGQHRDGRGAGRRRTAGAIATGSYSARRMPLDGDRRLHSAITRRRRARPVPPGSRRVGVQRRRRAAPASASGTRAADLRTRLRVAATMAPSRSLAPTRHAGRVLGGHPHQRAREPAQRSAAVDGRRGMRQCRREPTSARPATNKPAPALSSTMSRTGPALVRAASRRSDLGVRARRRRRRGRQRRLRQAEVAGVHVERAHGAVPALGDLRVAGRRDLVEAIGAVHDPHAVGAQHQQRARHQLGQLGPGTPTIWRVGAGRVGERTEQIERRAHAQLACARAPHAASTGWKAGREQERDAGLVEAALDHRRAAP